MRALKTILIIVLAVAGLLVLLAFLGPSTTVVTRSVVVEAPPEQVYPMIVSLRETDAWGPWADKEKDYATEWSSEDGVVGAYHSWDGDTLGKGVQRIVAIDPGKKVSTELRFLEPWESASAVDLELTPVEQGTKVDWTMTMENEGMGRLMAVFMNMDKMIGPDFEEGLNKLKARAEERQLAIHTELQAKTHRGYTIETVERPQMTYVGKRGKKVKWSEMEKFFGTNFGAAYGAVMAAGIEMAGQPSAVFFEWNEKEQTADVMAGIPVKADENLQVKGMETYTIPASRMLHIPYYGAYDKSENAHLAMDEMIKANGLTHYGNVIEEYITDPTTEPDTSKWLTNIYYMIR